MAEGGYQPEIATIIEKADIANGQTETSEIHAKQAIIYRQTTEIGTSISHAETAQVQAETANLQAQAVAIQQEIGTYIGNAQHVSVVHEHHYALPEKPISLSSKTEEFLNVVQQQTIKITTPKTKRQFKDLQQLEDEIFPKMTVVTMTGEAEKKESMQSCGKGDLSKTKLEKVIGSDLYEVQLQQLHDDHEGKSVNHVMILGDPGEGKSVSAMKYARLVAEKKVESLKDVELVHFVQVSKLHYGKPTTAFKLLFSQQVSNAFTEVMAAAGQKWLKENASKVLLVLDGLDQSRELFAGDFSNIDEETEAPTNTILSNLFTGHIYPEMKILSTARWHTYWDLKDDQIPHKIVALRGFDESKIREIFPKLCGEEEGKKIIEYLWSKALDLRSLCTTPLFLFCIAQVLVRDLSNSPDTLSGIMVGVLQYFFRSDHTKKGREHLQSYMKLAFNGIKDNHFVFSAQYIKSLGLDIKHLHDLLAADANLEFLLTAEEEDLELFFYHQTIQEVLAALYVCNMTAEKFKLLLEGVLNQPSMEVVRKFAYGILLHETTNKLAEKYLSGAKSEHTSIALDHLKKSVGQDAVRDIKILLLMHECGPKVIKDLQPMIKRIHVSEKALKPSEVYPVFAVVNHCIPLSSVTVQNVELNPIVLPLLQDALESIKYFEAKEVVIGEQLRQRDCESIMKVVRKLRIEKMTFKSCDKITREVFQHLIGRNIEVKISTISIQHNTSLDEIFSLLPAVLFAVRAEKLDLTDCLLTTGKLKEFQVGMKKRTFKLKTLDISKNKTMEAEAYALLSLIVGKVGVEELLMDDVDLTREKLECFRKNIISGEIKINLLSIDKNKSMQAQSFKVLAEILTSARVKQLGMQNCDLTTKKLQVLSENLTNVKLKVLVINQNKTMEAEAYALLSQIVGKVGVEQLGMNDVDLTIEKLECFRENIISGEIKINVLGIDENKSMQAPTYKVLAEILTSARVEQLYMRNCDLTTEKLLQLSENLTHVNLKALAIDQNKTMEAEAYALLSLIVGKVGVEELWMNDVDLTREKLECFRENIISGEIKINLLCIDENKSMQAPTYKVLAEILTSARVEQLLMRNCDLTTEKLLQLRENLTHVNLKVLEIKQNKTMEAEAYALLALIVGKVGIEELWMNDVDLTREKLECFQKNIISGEIKIKLLGIDGNKSMPAPAYKVLAEILTSARVEELYMRNCDLTTEKLLQLSENLTVQIMTLVIDENKSLSPDSYKVFAEIVSKTKPGVVSIDDCDLTSEKLGQYIPHMELLSSTATLYISRCKAHVTDEDFFVLCQLLQLVTLKIIAKGWMLSRSQQELLREQRISFDCEDLVIIFHDLETEEIFSL